MSRSGWIWTALMVVAGIYLLMRLATGGMGMVYVQDQPVEVQEPGQESWSRAVGVDPKRQGEEGVRVSWSRTVGTWLAALFTLCILSFLYGDNPLYKLAEAVFVGVSAGYWMVVGFWTGIVQNLFSKLAPGSDPEFAASGPPRIPGAGTPLPVSAAVERPHVDEALPGRGLGLPLGSGLLHRRHCRESGCWAIYRATFSGRSRARSFPWWWSGPRDSIFRPPSRI